VFHYDNADRVTAATWLSNAGVTVNLLTYTYDNNSNQLTAADYAGTVTTGYDALNRVTSQTDVFGLTLTYQYDTANRVTQRSDSKGGVLTYVYDNADRLTSQKLTGSSSAARVDLGYDNGNELTSLTRFTDVAGTTVVGTTAYAFDSGNRLTSIVNKTGGAATLSYYQYALDNGGRVTQETWQSLNTTGGTISGSHTYTYDATSQLTAADGTVYNWDLNGNSTNASKQTGSANRLTNDGVYTYTYDAAGDLIQQSKGAGLETWYYGYNTHNMLTSIRETTDGTTNELTVTYTLDVYNRRVEEDRWATGGVTTVTRTAYDDANVAWADLNGSNVVQVRYLAGPVVNQWFARIDVSGAEWLLTDRLGSIRDVTASAGTQVLNHTERYAFGGVISDTNVAVAGTIGWQGMWQDRTTNGVASQTRVWDTRTIQWRQEDFVTPRQIDAGDGNYRRPVGNDPTNSTDPTGGRPAPQEYWDRGRAKVRRAQVATEGSFNSDWYFDRVLGLWMYWWGETDDYREFQRGCVGLTNVRLGLPYGDMPYRSAEAGFKDFDSAMKYAQDLPAKPGKKVRIFAVLFKHLQIDKDKWDQMSGEIDVKNVVDIRLGGWDFVTLHQPKKEQSSWFWESMEEGYGMPNHNVEHMPFEWVMPANVEKKAHYTYVLFCVVYAKEAAVLPAAQTYGQ
jgi:RHS repeat-associated protein